MKRLCVFAALGASALILAILYLAGVFDSKTIVPDGIQARGVEFAPSGSVQASRRTVAERYEAVGTVRPKTEINVESQVTAKVRKVPVRSGSKVAEGAVLVVLDERELSTRRERAEQELASAGAGRRQAEQGIVAAKAGFDKAESTFRRMRKLFEEKAVTAEELERAETTFLQARAQLSQARDGLKAAEAGVRRAQKTVEEAAIALSHATITAREDGEVARRDVEPGDLAFPGKILMTIQTSGSLRLEALVREGVIGRVRVGDVLPVAVASLGEVVEGPVEEIVPSADPATRSFVVKVGLPPLPGLYPGMFGRLLIPLREKQVVAVPAEAVRRVGQLATVLVRSGNGWTSLYVRTGDPLDDGMVEVLSGLHGNETLGVGGEVR